VPYKGGDYCDDPAIGRLDTDLFQGVKHIGIQYVFPIISVQSFDMGVLHWLSWLDVALPRKIVAYSMATWVTQI
jgi:hypothetical protein